MKNLLNGVAIAAVLAITAPAWAQNAPMTPAAPAMPMAKKPMMAKRPMMHHHMAGRHHWHHHWVRHHAGDDMTEQLNREELARLMHGGAAMSAPEQSASPEMGGPRASSHH
ncbi:MAG TPA: hypothetical protein VND87_02430 [Stellaceae bacterium]|nr:hypothetical protein [Stellaceae bacterium]